jgi:hypothetical protein
MARRRPTSTRPRRRPAARPERGAVAKPTERHDPSDQPAASQGHLALKPREVCTFCRLKPREGPGTRCRECSDKGPLPYRRPSPEETIAKFAGYTLRVIRGERIEKSFGRARRKLLVEAQNLSGGEAAHARRIEKICHYLAVALSNLTWSHGGGLDITKEDVLEAVQIGFPPRRGNGAVTLDRSTLEKLFTWPAIMGRRDRGPINESKLDRLLAQSLHCDERTIRRYRRALKKSSASG